MRPQARPAPAFGHERDGRRGEPQGLRPIVSDAALIAAPQSADPLLASGLCVYIASLLGIVYLMTTKPALVQSFEAMIVAVAIGALVSAPLWRLRSKRPNAQAAPREA